MRSGTPRIVALAAALTIVPGLGTAAPATKRYSEASRFSMPMPALGQQRVKTMSVLIRKRVRHPSFRMHIARDSSSYGAAIPPKRWAFINDSTGRHAARIRFVARYSHRRQAFDYKVELENLALPNVIAARATVAGLIVTRFGSG